MTDTGLEALAEVDRGSRIGRTSLQATIATGVVSLVEYALALQKWDLDPWSDGTGMPSTVVASLVGLITVALSFLMNRKPPAEPSPSQDLVDSAAAVAGPQPPPDVDPAHPRH